MGIVWNLYSDTLWFFVFVIKFDSQQRFFNVDHYENDDRYENVFHFSSEFPNISDINLLRDGVGNIILHEIIIGSRIKM